MRRPRIWCSLPGRSPKFWVALLAVALIVPALAAPLALADNDTIMPGDAIPGDAPHGDGPLIPTIPQQVDATVPTWFPATISGTAGRRHGHAGIVDPVSHRYILFGGFRSGDNIRLGDLWSYSFAERSWTQLSSIGGPSPRFGHTAVYDPGNARMVVFGGYDGAPRNDLWLLSLSGAPVWTAVTPPGESPDARFGHSAIYDPVRRRIVVYGGFGSDGLYRGDLWALSLDGAPVWSRLVTTGETPGPRDYHSAIYDVNHDRMAVFGGNNGAALNELWFLEFDKSTRWKQIHENQIKPLPRLAHAAVYDQAGDRMLVFGGVREGPVYYNDVWSLPLSRSNRWRQLAPPGDAHPGGNVFGTALDPVDGKLVVYGGEFFGSLDRMHALSISSPETWERLTPREVGPQPGGRYGHVSVLDPIRHRMLMYGGDVVTGPDAQVWSFGLDGDAPWVPVATTGLDPGARFGHSLIYDPPRDRLLMFGGYRPQSASFGNDVWQLDLATLSWSPLVVPGGPSARDYHSAVYDAAGDRMLVFGGNNSSGFLNDVWVLGGLAGTPAWTQLNPSGLAPVARLAHCAHYDVSRGVMLMFGGYSVVGYRNDLWELQLTPSPVWTYVDPVGTPPSPRYSSTWVEDAANQRLLLFAGIDQNGTSQNDLFELHLSDRAWSPVAAAGGPPRPRHGPSAVFDPTNRQMVVFGGASHLSERFSDTWRLQLPAPVGPAAPPSRATLAPQATERLWVVRRSSRIMLALPRDQSVDVEVYDVSGRKWGHDRYPLVTAGIHDITPSGSAPPTGVYFVRVRSGSFRSAIRWSVIH